MRKRLLSGGAVAAALTITAPAHAEDPETSKDRAVNGVKVIEDCTDRKRPSTCRWRRHRLLRIAPYVSFLASTGACESGTTGNLRHGLAAHNPGGQYHGRYQFLLSSWAGAGGSSDPHDASWLEQAYRAVRLLEMQGRSAWPVCADG